MPKSHDKIPIKKPKLEAIKLAELLMRAEHLSRSRLYFQSFVRGVFFGFGSLLGASVLIAFLAWVLSLFEVVPLVGPLVENLRENIER